MSQDSERRLSRASLAPPAEIAGPSTPIKRASLSASPVLSIIAASHASQSDKSKFPSPPPLSSSDMTPPPSSQVPPAPLRRSRSRSRSNSYLASPPDLEKTLCAAYGASENLPSAEEIETADEMRLRIIAKELLGVAQEARMSALHFKLQHSLLSFASNEAVKRAEVEQQLARREVEILQSSEYRNRHLVTEIKSAQPASNVVELESALKHNQELEMVNATLDRRLRRAKKMIEEEKEKSEHLAEENLLLKKRIRDNREHLSLMLDQGSLSPNSQTEYQTPQRRFNSRFSDHNASPHLNHNNRHDPFAALLAADKVLNRGAASVNASPYGQRMSRPQPGGHVRGSHSISSLPMTPTPPRIGTARNEEQYMTPAHHSRNDRPLGFSSDTNQADHGGYDRDSTISASDGEAVTDEDVPGSLVSSVAADTRRQNPTDDNLDHHAATRVPKSSTLLQTKLFGQVRKPGTEPSPRFTKRKASFDGDNIASKKSRPAEEVGLGIKTWGVEHT
ncbi:hypothetical protein ASPZODRAFT_66751 [Penicilliopsis zonata CBS 506.65]|uniref:Uncharacterized protein n=1 Tax=Penicilliopsis zonata CBS 506.65 TaxID=1073090 RepID=A0A1L9SGQ5_9EURO|nr:hypothetical protein ASPZODRAFT_66751 [Penicilliopsis zonata CBS 506.65]OJJ46362.1 hypothetical protein ASPZODRAFT_66751 [Penicilliopsis zonata CBS 506.65]